MVNNTKRFTMKKTITLKDLKRIVTEANSDVDMNLLFEEFQNSFFEDFIDFLENTGGTEFDNLIEKQLSDKWEAYSDDRQDLLTCNVKGYGLGDWNLFNKNNRAEDEGITIEDYSHYLQTMNTDFFYDWDATFKKNFGVELFSAGRSNGHWGFRVKDILSSYRILEPNRTEVKKLFDKITKNASEDDLLYPDDLAYAAMELVDYDKDITKYLKFNDKFVEALSKFEDELVKTSNNMASKKFNDELFDYFFEKVNQ